MTPFYQRRRGAAAHDTEFMANDPLMGHSVGMIEDDIAALVADYYQRPHSGVLMLSNVGALLSKVDKWPLADDDTRTLTQIVEGTPGVMLIRDPSATSFIAVVLNGDEHLAEAAIAQRKTRYFLRGLPRALILAFCLEVAPGQDMYLRLEPSVSYQAGPDAGEEGFILVDEDLRLPGLPVDDMAALGGEDVAALETNIRTWCDRHGIVAETLGKKRTRSPSAPVVPVEKRTSSALERLYAAQSHELADRLIVPIDIALMLSRLP